MYDVNHSGYSCLRHLEKANPEILWLSQAFIAPGREGIQFHAGTKRCSSKHAWGKQADTLEY